MKSTLLFSGLFIQFVQLAGIITIIAFMNDIDISRYAMYGIGALVFLSMNVISLILIVRGVD